MKMARGAGFALLLTCLSVTTLGAQGALVDNPYYPFKVNTTWTYKAPDNKQLVMKITKHEKVGNALCARLETSIDGKVVATEFIGVNADGICRFQVGDNMATPPMCFLKLPPGTTPWKIESKIGGETVKGTFTPGKEEVTVPLGKFQTITCTASDFDVSGTKMGMTSYFAKDVGMVKQIIKLGDKQTIVVELEKFEAGK